MNPKVRRVFLKYGGFVLLALIILVFCIALFMGVVTATFGRTGFTINCTLLSGRSTIHYEDISDVYLEDDLDRGDLKFGVSTKELQAGRFENAEFGKYKLYTQTGSDLYIVVKCGGDAVVFSLEDEAATRAAYESLLSML